MLIYYSLTGCGAVGSALDWGSRGREFKSRHSDQKIPFTKVGGIFYLLTINYSLFTKTVFVNGISGKK